MNEEGSSFKCEACERNFASVLLLELHIRCLYNNEFSLILVANIENAQILQILPWYKIIAEIYESPFYLIKGFITRIVKSDRILYEKKGSKV